MTALHITTINVASDTFEIQVFDGKVKIPPPYTLTSGKQYRLQAVSSDNKTRAAQWFIAGNLGRITTGEAPILTAVFVGEGSLICRVDGTEQRAKLSVVPATKIIGSGGGKLESPIAVAITLPKSALATEQQIGIEIVAPPGLPPAAQQFVRVIRISPERLVLKRSVQITFRFETDANPQIYFWEPFGRRWVPLRGSVNANEGSVTAAIKPFRDLHLDGTCSQKYEAHRSVTNSGYKTFAARVFCPEHAPTDNNVSTQRTQRDASVRDNGHLRPTRQTDPAAPCRYAALYWCKHRTMGRIDG